MLFPGLERLRAAVGWYQGNWLADTSKVAKTSQCKIYLRFCQEYELDPLPASLETVLLYLAHLAESRSYVTIINYLSAVWTLHKINGIPHVDPKDFQIKSMLRGIRRALGDEKKQARPISVYELRLIFATLDMNSSQDVAFWLALLICFRGLLRKSNVVEKGLAVLCSDVHNFPWGVLLVVRRTKTICFKERKLEIPFNFFPGSIFCVARFYRLLRLLVDYPSPDSQLISYMESGEFVRGSYTWLGRKLTGVSSSLGLDPLSSHSLRRGGAMALEGAGFTLLQVKDMGDWSSLAALQYISRTLSSRRNLDFDMCDRVFKLH